MTGLIIALSLILIVIVVVQIGKVAELASRIRGEEQAQIDTNNWNAWLSLLFLVVFLVGVFVSAGYYKNYMLGYGPHAAASEHGSSLDGLFDVTLFFTGIVFVLTHIALFWFAFKYRGLPDRKARFLPHNNTVEIVWTVIPAIVMTYLVINGLDSWNTAMADVGPDEDYIEIEATGTQFNWLIRYPGEDGALGSRDYKQITGLNPLGQDWEDPKNLDDFQPNEIVLPVNKKVRVRITSRDVLHNFYLPQFRVKMDAVPGMPTYFVFTPVTTTEEYRMQLRQYPEYNVPADPEDPESPMLWEEFNYELACAELCGKGHYSMRRVVRIVSEAEYENWLDQQTSWYFQSVRNSDEDPYKGQLLNVEIERRKEEFSQELSAALEAESAEERKIILQNIRFETGSAELDPISEYELENVKNAMEENDDLRIELAGHTDDVGNPQDNMELSRDRAQSVKEWLVDEGISPDRLVAKGYGEEQPIADNTTEGGRAENRRIEFRIISK